MAALNSLYLWKHCKILKLTTNMRLLTNNLTIWKAEELKDFSKWILDVADINLGGENDGDAVINIPKEFLITDAEYAKNLSKKICGDVIPHQQNKDPNFFQERAILCPTNEDVKMINQHMLDKLDG